MFEPLLSRKIDTKQPRMKTITVAARRIIEIILPARAPLLFFALGSSSTSVSP
jgi:hypothetical protein